MDNFNKFSINLINNNANNFQEDAIRKLQANLIIMGFDILMVNKTISYFKIRTVDEALNYLIKSEDGLWNHPFIPKEIIKGEGDNRILEQPKIMVNNVINRISSSVILMGSRNESEQNENKVDYRIENDICDICGELKDFHKIKDYEINLDNNKNNNNNIFNNENNKNNYADLNFNKNNNIFNDIDGDSNLAKDIEEFNNILIDDDEKEDEKEEEKEEIDPNKCPICMDDFENPVEIENCKHKFCYECFNLYLVNLINNNNIDKIPCPKKNCSNQALSENFFSQYLNEQEYFKFRQFKSQNEIARDAKKFFCPHCNSYAQIEGNIEEYDSNNPNYKKSTLKCKNGHSFCSCGRPLHENECFQDEKEFKELITNEEIKKCPKCSFLIKKDRGCNHMTCGNPMCKYEFCWLCMNEAVPGHYEFGPCAGRQFFDPNSLSYYIEQNYPILSYVYEFIRYFLVFLNFVICCLLLPGIGLAIFSFGMIFVEDTFRREFNNDSCKYIYFMTCFCLGFCFQSIAYMFWLTFSFVIGSLLFFVIIESLARMLIKCIKDYIFSLLEYDVVQRNRIIDELELSNSFNNENP